MIWASREMVKRSGMNECLSCLDIWNDRMTYGRCSVLFSKTVSVDERVWDNAKHSLLAIQSEVQSIRSQQRMKTDEVHRQMILFALDLLCRYLLVLEHLILNNDQQPTSKKQKRPRQTCHLDWSINERDEVLHLFTTLIQLDLRQFWHETERLEAQQIGRWISLLSPSLINGFI